MVRLGRREQDAVGARAEQRAQEGAPPDLEAVEDRFESAPSRSCTASGPALKAASASTSTIWRSSRAKCSRKNGRTQHVLVGFVTAPHHRPQRAFRRRRVRRQIERRKGERRRAGEVARHQETSGRQQAQGILLVAAGEEVFGEEPRRGDRRLLVGRRARVEAGEVLVPGLGEGRPRPAARQREAFLRPGLVALVEERQVEQPLAGIVDDIEGELAHRPGARLVFDDEPQFADLPRRLRPDAVGEQRVKMALIVEARHRIVGLRR